MTLGDENYEPSWEQIISDCPEIIEQDERFMEDVTAMLADQEPVEGLLGTIAVDPAEATYVVMMHDGWCDKLTTGGKCCCKPEKQIVRGKDLDQYITKQ